VPVDSGRIQFAPDILRRLGEELNPNVDQGILELVKNSYDADARSCTVALINTAKPGGRIEVRDNGDGMTVEQIKKGWFVLGSSSKNQSVRTRLGRVPAGDKGLGRLAALRMGREAIMITRPRGSSSEFVVSINWARYDKANLVEQVEIPIEERPRTKVSPGTEIILINVRDAIGRTQAKRLARAMILLSDPFTDGASGFTPILRSQDFTDLERLVQERYFAEAEFHLSAVLDNGVARAAIVDWEGQPLYEASHNRLAEGRGGLRYHAPDATFDLWAFLLSNDRFVTKPVTLQEVREWINNFGGVHVYLNGLRVAPYGNPGNDWLDMNVRRAQNPEERPSTNNSIGRLAIADSEGALSQKTDRSGFIDSLPFEELHSFAYDALEWLAAVRLDIAERRRRAERQKAESDSSRSRQNVREQIGRTSGNVRDDLERAFERYDRERQRENDALRREVQLYRTLSTAGITAATFAHESSGNPLKVIGQSVNALDYRAKTKASEVYEEQFKEPIESIRTAAESLGVLSAATLGLIEADKRRVGRIDLHKIVTGVLDTFQPFFNDRDIKVEPKICPDEPYLRGTDAALESIITNLINNSISAFEVAGTLDRKIRVETQVLDRKWILTVADNGPGIEGIGLNDIWLPGQTSRPNGTGLGLTIVRDAVHDLGGKERAVAHGELGGASFVVELPIIGVGHGG
jgi:signal transduction histidine kinase